MRGLSRGFEISFTIKHAQNQDENEEINFLQIFFFSKKTCKRINYEAIERAVLNRCDGKKKEINKKREKKMNKTPFILSG